MTGGSLHTEIDVTETAASNLAADSVFVSDAEILPWSALCTAAMRASVL